MLRGNLFALSTTGPKANAASNALRCDRPGALCIGRIRRPPNAIAGQLRVVLLGYLCRAESVAAWPGADGLTIDDILDFYPQAVTRGEVPEWLQLVNRHPELSIELHDWLAAKDRWRFAFRQGAESTV